MTDRQNISSGTPWEREYGYSRAVRVGNMVFVAGTVASDENGNPVGTTLYEQTRAAYAKVGRALEQAGSSLEHVVRIRTFVTDASQWQQAARAQGEVFGAIRPASTLVEVSALIDNAFLVEVEADAVIPNGKSLSEHPSP
jgi:enamine deaminase RidA (YjgF/YER057c/UK114 family)